MIYFVRHGETEFNKNRIFQGHLDIPLNDTGIAQAKQVLEDSKDISFDIIYYSPLSRAKQTAEIINSYHNKKMIADDRLKEIFMGSLQGRAHNDLSEEERQLSYTSPEYFGGETHEEFCARVKSFLDEIDDSNKTILIVSHGGVYRAIYKILNNLSDLQFSLQPLKNATIVLIKK